MHLVDGSDFQSTGISKNSPSVAAVGPVSGLRRIYSGKAGLLEALANQDKKPKSF